VRRPKAFTIVELLVVIAIIAVLMSILVPALQKARDQAKAVVCLTRLRGIGQAMQIYAANYKEYVMRGADPAKNWPYWMVAYMPYVGGASGDIKDFWEVKTYDCPAYPTKEQIVDFVINAWDFTTGGPEGAQANDPTKLAVFNRAEDTIYVADYDYNLSNSLFRLVKRGDSPDSMKQALQYFDIWSSTHLPPAADATRRVARDHLRRADQDIHQTSSNALFVDGHATAVPAYKNDRWLWGGPPP